MSTQPAPSATARRPFRGFDARHAAYGRIKAELVATQQGRYVVLVGETSIGPFASHSEAERAGYAKFGLGPLDVKRVEAEESLVEVSRFAAP